MKNPNDMTFEEKENYAWHVDRVLSDAISSNTLKIRRAAAKTLINNLDAMRELMPVGAAKVHALLLAKHKRFGLTEREAADLTKKTNETYGNDIFGFYEKVLIKYGILPTSPSGKMDDYTFRLHSIDETFIPMAEFVLDHIEKNPEFSSHSRRNAHPNFIHVDINFLRLLHSKKGEFEFLPQELGERGLNLVLSHLPDFHNVYFPKPRNGYKDHAGFYLAVRAIERAQGTENKALINRAVTACCELAVKMDQTTASRGGKELLINLSNRNLPKTAGGIVNRFIQQREQNIHRPFTPLPLRKAHQGTSSTIR